MPWKLIPPRPGKTKVYYVRGTYLGIRLDHSTGTGEADAAKRILATWRKRAERGEFSEGRRADEPAPATFVNAATAYMRAGGSGQYLEPILKAWNGRLATDIDQIALDTNEALTRHLRHLRLDRAFLYLPDSKTGDPRGCHLPPELVLRFQAQPPRKSGPVVRDERGHFLTGKPLEDADVPFLDDGGALRDMLKTALRNAGLSFPRRQGGFHLFCHTYGSWMHQYGKLDRHGLTRTGRWADPDSADRYVHTQASEEARRADLLPMRRGQLVEIKKQTA